MELSGTPFDRKIHLLQTFPILLFVFDLIDNWLSDDKQIYQDHMSKF